MQSCHWLVGQELCAIFSDDATWYNWLVDYAIRVFDVNVKKTENLHDKI